MTRTWTETEIAALVDGELEGEARARALRAVAEDPEAAALAESIRATNDLLRRAYPLTPVAVPDALRAASPSRRPARRRDGGRAALPLRRLAAGIAMAALAAGAAAWLLSSAPGTVSGDALALAPGPVPADGPVHRALEELATGAASAEGLRVAATYLDRDARPCREFETGLAAALACRTPAGRWDVVASATLAPDASPSATAVPGFSAASGSSAPDPIADALDALGAGPALRREDEARLRASWR